MKYTVEESLSNFKFWSGAKTNAEKLTEEELDRVENMLPDLFGEELSEVQINDLFWFDFGYICELLGLTEEEVDNR